MVDSFVQESPEQKTTRDSLGKGSIFVYFAETGGAIGDDVLAYADIIFLTRQSVELLTQTPMPKNGKLLGFIVNLQNNSLTENVVLTIRKNGVDTTDIITIKPTDIGVKSFPLSTEFLQGDLLSVKSEGAGVSTNSDYNGGFYLQYDN